MKTLTPKAQATRDKLLATAVRLFADKGYQATTMRGIAKEAEVSTGLAYRYFDSKEALVAELYSQLSQQFVEQAVLAPGPWIQRTLSALDVSFAVLAPHREVLAAVMASSTTQPSLSPPLARNSHEVEAVFRAAVTGARNPPKDAAAIGEAAYFVQLAMLLFWVLDRSEDQVATTRLRAWVAGTLPMFSFALRIPGATRPLRVLLGIVRFGILGQEEGR